ncbi:MAG: hypothetical protein ACR2IF_05855 [Terriglobales bacterium]
MRRFSLILAAAVVVSTLAFAQAPPKRPAGSRRAENVVTGQTYESRKKFVLETIQSAVALPQADPQDHLRVLTSAARLASSVSPALARSLARQGAEIETQLVASGQRPAVSVLETGLVDCATATRFVESIPPEALANAEQALIGVSGKCSGAVPAIQRKLDDAARQGSVPPRIALAAMDASGIGSVWSQREFESLFSSLPDAQQSTTLAPALAEVFDRAALAGNSELAAGAGIKFLEWLSKMDPAPERSQAVTVTTGTLKKVLGEQRYQEALRANLMASQVAQTAGQPFELPPPQEDTNISVLRAMASGSSDKSEELSQLGAPQRARQSAAYGFASGKAGDKAAAHRYFDTAYSALDDSWENRVPGQDVVALVEEVSGAAARVDAIAALNRAQKLNAPPARAISMLAVAQAVLTQQTCVPPSVTAANPK